MSYILFVVIPAVAVLVVLAAMFAPVDVPARAAGRRVRGIAAWLVSAEVRRLRRRLSSQDREFRATIARLTRRVARLREDLAAERRTAPAAPVFPPAVDAPTVALPTVGGHRGQLRLPQWMEMSGWPGDPPPAGGHCRGPISRRRSL
jgi:hypothetical protein